MNKKLIRLTESDLHNIVKESVNKILCEIGDTQRGQWMLGRLKNRQSNGGGKFSRGINYMRIKQMETLTVMTISKDMKMKGTMEEMLILLGMVINIEECSSIMMQKR